MDELKITSKLMRNMIAKVISRIIRKKLGYKIDIQINDAIIARITDGEAHVHLNIDAKMNSDEFVKVTKIIDSEE